MFEKLNLSFNKSKFDKEKDVSRVQNSEFSLPLVNAKDGDNGIMYYGRPEDFDSETMTIDIVNDGAVSTGNVYSQPQKTGVLYNAYLIKSKFGISEPMLHFFAVTIQKSIKMKFSYELKASWERVKEEQIQLPIKEKSSDFSNPCDNIKNIDFDFMETFIRELEEERIRELNAYLLATGLKDYALSAEEEKALEAFKTVQWGEYRIGDLYKKLDLHNKDFDKREDTASEPTKEYSLPIVNAKHGDNGIMFYGKEDIFDSAEMTIDIVQNGAVATGDVYPQPQRTGILWDAYLIKALDHTDSKETLFFITSSIQKSIKQKFCYEFKATWDRVQREKIYLPTKNNKPDYATMETFIKAVEKLVIKDVVLYADSKIKATKNVVKKDFEYKINEDAGLLHVADSIN